MKKNADSNQAASLATARHFRGIAAKSVSILLLALLGGFGDTPLAKAQGQATPPPASGYRLVFADDFQRLDLSPNGSGAHTWHEGLWWSEKRAPRRNIAVSGSILSLRWERGQGTSDTSITTFSRDRRHFHAWRYGYFEARMRWQPVPGAWPAFWLLPVQDATGQNKLHGKKESGEIDIFEGLGDHPHTFFGTVHDWVGDHDSASQDNEFRLSGDADLSAFHTYGLLWVPGKVTWYFDNRPLHTENTPAICDRQDFFLVLGMQEGVDWKQGDLSGVNASSMTLYVDWVRVWQKE